MTNKQVEQLTGMIDRITYHNDDNGYTVLRLLPEGQVPMFARSGDVVTVVGVMPQFNEGERAQFGGRWVEDPRYGYQFKCETAVPLPVETAYGIVRYLADTVFGVGEATAKRIYDHFGSNTLYILENNPERIHEMRSLKPNIRENIIEAFQGERERRRVMVALQGYGISSSFARRIYEHYGLEAIAIVRDDPYQLADSEDGVEGIGFKRADAIARSVGIPHDSPKRLRAGLRYTLAQLALDGHTFVPREILLRHTAELLDVEETDTLAELLSEQVQQETLRVETLFYQDRKVDAVYLPMYHHCETMVAYRLRQLSRVPSRLMEIATKRDWRKLLAHLSQKNNVSLSEQQQDAVRAALTSKVSVLTGGPGTGKTTTLQMVIHALEALKCSYALAAPTGRAAKRLAEATGEEASTIHRLLGVTSEGFEHDHENPLPVDMLVLDETSMLDLILFHHVLKALKPTTHLMLVGDVDQLPSVGAGNVLRDVIQSGVAHVTRLKQIFRQDKKSYIVVNAHRINDGEMPFTDNQSDDFFFFSASSAQEAAALVVDIVKNRLPNKFGVNPLDDVQVIAPMYRGAGGVDALNAALQQELNSGYGLAEKRIGERIFRKNDKIMQTKNNYEKEVFNGDIGRIYSIGNDGLAALIDGRAVEYSLEEAREQLIHAYCISTHRSQGAEYPVVVMPILTQHYMMLQRNLLYTAITRARKIVVLVGDRRAIQIAVQNNKIATRYSGLLARLLNKVDEQAQPQLFDENDTRY